MLIPDAAPTVEITEVPSGDSSGMLTAKWKVSDDYGVSGVTSDIYLADDQDEGVGANLGELRRVVEDLDPGRRGKLTGPRKFLGIIEREAQRLQALVSDLMSLSRVEAEKHDLPTTRIDLASLVERAARDAAGPQRLDRLALALNEMLDQIESLMAAMKEVSSNVAHDLKTPLTRIKALNPKLNAVIAVDPTAIDQARALDRQRKARGIAD